MCEAKCGRDKLGLSARAAELSEAHLFAGRTTESTELAQRALDLARHHQERGHEAYALRLLGEIASQGDPPEVEKAEGHYRDAMALAQDLGMRPLVAHCHLGLGKFYRRTRKQQEAQEHLTTATSMYREMDMPYWLEQAETELKALG